MTKHILLLSCAAGALSLGAVEAHAATATDTAAAAANENGGATSVLEVVVTAEKREQNLQDVPVAISAFTSEKRDVVGIQSIQDMTNFTPGLGYSTSTDRITLRGVGRTTNVLSADAPVANYDDGLYETFAVAAGRSSLDLDRVEILRGPQGTLAGRNALGGALNEITNRPTAQPYAEARITYGNYDHITLEGAVSGPLNDKWGFRVYGTWEKQSQGWIKNSVVGQPDSGNIINEWYLDAQIQGKISDKLDMWTKFQSAGWSNGSGGPGADSAGWADFGFPTAEFANGNAFLFPNSAFACNGPSSGTSNVVNNSRTGCNNAALNNPRAESEQVTHRVSLPLYVSLNSQWTWHADGFDIKYIGGGTYYHYILTGANALSPVVSETLPVAHNGHFIVPIPPAPVGSHIDTGLSTCVAALGAGCSGLNFNGQDSFRYQELNGFWSNEINFISTGNGPLQWVAGLYEFQQHYTQPVSAGNVNTPQFLTPVVLGAVPVTAHTTNYFDNRPSVSDTSLAAFGQVDWKATDTVKLTLGLRYSTDRKYGTESVRLLDFGNVTQPEDLGVLQPAFDLTQLGTVVDQAPGKGITSKTTFDPATGLATRHYDASWSAPSGTAGIEWQPDTDTLVYAKYGRGYKSGGFNIGIFTVLSFEPWTDSEHVDSFEIGLKKTFGHWLQLNAAAFYYSYQNLQIPISIAQTAGGLAQSETAFLNVPKALSQGIELETTWTPIDNLVVLFNYSYDDAHTVRGVAPDAEDPNAIAPGAKPLLTGAQCAAILAATPTSTQCTVDIYTSTPAQGFGGTSPVIAGDPNQGFNIPQNLAGNRLPNAPRNKIAINVLYNFKMDAGTLTPSISWVWRDKAYGNLFTRSYTAAPSWDQWDARVTWKSANGKYEIIAFGKNIANTIGYDQGANPQRLSSVTNVLQPDGTYKAISYVQGVNGPAGFNSHVANANSLGVVQLLYPTPPRTFGIEFHYKFF
ncbi:MAG: TonB-dependent receptor [Caulobacterales bacterium]